MESGETTNYHRESERERTTDGENRRVQGGRGVVLTALVHVIEVRVVGAWRGREGGKKSAVWCSIPNSMDVQTGGCLPTLGPVLNAGRVVQSQKYWLRRKGDSD